VLQSKLPQGKHTSHTIDILNKHHYNRTNDFYNKCASYVINYCITNNIGTIVIGKNTQWKQNINIGHKNNQTFCFIAHSTLIEKIKLMAVNDGIEVIVTEESYTSKASFLDNDDIPTYDNDETAHKFSGKRKYRGLYISKDGVLLNADINGASNIIKKGYQGAFDKLNNFAYLYQSVVKIQIN
jgi:putative transposase